MRVFVLSFIIRNLRPFTEFIFLVMLINKTTKMAIGMHIQFELFNLVDLVLHKSYRINQISVQYLFSLVSENSTEIFDFGLILLKFWMKQPQIEVLGFKSKVY